MVIMITGLLEFLDRHLWMSRRQRERCLTTSPLKMTRSDLKKKSLTIAKCEEILREKYVQETAGTGGDSITSTLVDYPINPFYLPS